MKSIIIKAKDNEELKLLSSLFEKMKIKYNVLSEEEKEDLGLIELMKEVDRNDNISKDIIIKKLRKKSK
jgi:hypothetical protein